MSSSFFSMISSLYESIPYHTREGVPFIQARPSQREEEDWSKFKHKKGYPNTGSPLLHSNRPSCIDC